MDVFGSQGLAVCFDMIFAVEEVIAEVEAMVVVYLRKLQGVVQHRSQMEQGIQHVVVAHLVKIMVQEVRLSVEIVAVHTVPVSVQHITYNVTLVADGDILRHIVDRQGMNML